MNTKHQWQQYLAEFIGTFFLVFFGCGSMILAELNPTYDGAFIPIVFGGAVAIMIYATGHISGAHFNPAVTLAFWVTRKFSSKRILGYVLAQIFGATTASFFHHIIFGPEHDFGQTVLSTTLMSGFLIEFILSFVLMFVITSVATDSRAVGELAGMAIGTTVTLCAFVGGPLTNASMNPARTLGPAIFNMEFNQLWVYVLAPIIGTIFGAKVYEWIRCYNEKEGEHGCC